MRVPLVGAGLFFWFDLRVSAGSSLLYSALGVLCGILAGPRYLVGKWLALGTVDDAEITGCLEWVLTGCVEGCASGFLLLSLCLLVALLLMGLL